jgi:lipopolysaccharide transport system ATP-binding protein
MIMAVGMTDASGSPVQQTRIGTEIVFRVQYRSYCAEPLHVTLVMKNRYDQVVTATGSYMLKTPVPRLEPNQEAVFEIRVCPLIEAGDYSFLVSLAQPQAQAGTGTIVDETPQLGPLRVTWDYGSEIPPFYGMVGLQSTARFLVGLGA